MQRENRKIPFMGVLLKKIVPRIGAVLNIEPKWGSVGQIIFKNGKKIYFRNSSIDLNTMGASAVAVDKDYASYFLNKMGYPVISGRVFYSTKWCKVVHSKNNIDKAYKYACRIGFPVILKPNSKSQGKGVTKVFNKNEFYKTAERIFKIDNIMLVQTFIPGKDYRIVVVDKKIISVYERTPLFIIGDGTSSIEKLLSLKQKEFLITGRDTIIDFDDFRVKANLKRANLSLKSILKKEEKIYLLDNANLSTGGLSLDVSKKIHPSFKKVAISITKDMGLRLCGVDIIVKGDIEKKISKNNQYFVLEINSAPGLDNYYASGKKQKKIVEELYLNLLKAMSK